MNIKLSSLVLDFYDDTDGVIARQLPQELHRVKIASQEEVDALPDTAFALVFKTASGVLRRRFPVDTPDNIKLSEAYLDRVQDQLPPDAVHMARAKIAAAKEGKAQYEVAYVDTTKTAARKTASISDRFYGLSVGTANKFPLHTAAHVKMAESRFTWTTATMEPKFKFAYARNIASRAAQLGVDLPATSAVHNYTNTTLNKVALAQAVKQRKQAAFSKGLSTEVLDSLLYATGAPIERGGAESQAAYDQKLADAKIACANHTAVQPEHVIGMLMQYDKAAGLGPFEYNRGMLDPFASVYKHASFTPGASVDGIDLGSISPEMLQQAGMDDDFIQQFMANPEQVYQSLPDPVKRVIQQAAAGSQAPQPAPQSPDGGVGPLGQAAANKGDPMTLLNPAFADGTSTDVAIR